MVEPLQFEAASNRRRASQNNTSSENFSQLNNGDNGRALDKVAIVTGLSRPTYSKAKQVVEAAKQQPELNYIVEEMDETGKVDRAFKEFTG